MFGNKINNSGWILCPSKRFPGKFYYYNVVNGESAWCFNETEKNFLMIDDRTKLTQKWHSYPEPLSPPGRGFNCLNRSNLLLPQNFGQASFPKYLSPAAPKPDGLGAINCIPSSRNLNVLMTPTFGVTNVHKPLVPKKNIDIQTDLPETEVMVQSCKEPLSERFLKYHKIENEQNNLEILNGKYFESSKVFKNPKNETQMVQGAGLGQENLSIPMEVNNSINSSQFNSESKLQLDDNDLRYILRAKKSDKKTVSDEPVKKSSVKKVRFDLTSSIHNDNNEYESEDEIAIKDAFNTATEKIVKHVHKTGKSDNLLENQLYIEDNIKNIKFVVKNNNLENMFLQRTPQFKSFQFKSEKITNLGKKSENQNENSVDIINENQTHDPTPNDSYVNFDILNVTKSMKEKLHLRVPSQFGGNSKILFLKTTPQENPFKRYKSKINPYLKFVSSPKEFSRPPGLYTSKELKKNNFKLPFICSVEHKVTSKKDINYFDPKLYSNNSSTAHLNNSFISPSGYARDQTNSGHNNNKSKTTEKCLMFSDQNEIDTKNSWLNHKLKNFYNRNSYIECAVKIRMDEIICSFSQIMENIICEILQTSSCPPPHSLYDALLCLQRKFSHHTHILQVVDRITDLDIFCSKSGYIKSNVYPHELIKALGCGLVFIEALNESEEYDAMDAENALLQLLRDIEEPESVELPQPTTVSRDGSTEQLNRTNFIKGRSEIVSYLRKHFPEWENYCEEQYQTPTTNNQSYNVVVTTGKDLHHYKINSKNQIYCEPEEVIETNDFNNKECDTKKVITKFHVIEEFENRIRANLENELAQSKDNQENIDDTSEDNKLVIDERTPEEIYEDNTNKYSEESIVLIEHANEVNDPKPSSPRIDTSIRINESSTITDDFPVLNNDPVTHIFAEDANQHYFLVKTFLTELSNCLLSIHAFIKDCAERMHDTELTVDDRQEIHANANQIYINLRNIILELKSIVDRETRNENALKILLMGADGALQDKRITNYRQVTAKCVEQARHLAGCVRLLLRATDRDCTLSASSDASTTCINIFE